MKKNLIFVIVITLFCGFVFYMFSIRHENHKNKIKPIVASSDLVKDYSPTLGPENSKVTVVEFLDPECEACRTVDPFVKGLIKDLNVRYVVRYAPFHPNSALAIALLEEARNQGKYWEALSTLFYYQPSWGDHQNPKPELMRDYLKALGVKITNTDEELVSKHQKTIYGDRFDAGKIGVKSTPTFFINGVMLDRIDYDSLKNAILENLK